MTVVHTLSGRLTGSVVATGAETAEANHCSRSTLSSLSKDVAKQLLLL